jgi:glycosyltransferase involved in cell wall biosynthesis
LELKTLSAADALVVISQPLAEELSMLHKREVYAITHGFDPDKMSNGKNTLTSKFTITYTGQVYKKQDSSKLLIALKDLISDSIVNLEDVEVRFYGPENELLMKHAQKYGLSAIVKQYGVISRADSLEKQKETQLLLQINWEDPRKKGLYSGKIFEYLAAQRPIIATGENDTVEKLLYETGAGMYCPTIEDIKNALKRSYSEYELNGKVTYRGDIEKINKYSYQEIARKFAEILDKVKGRNVNT